MIITKFFGNFNSNFYENFYGAFKFLDFYEINFGCLI